MPDQRTRSHRLQLRSRMLQLKNLQVVIKDAMYCDPAQPNTYFLNEHIINEIFCILYSYSIFELW